MHAPQKRLLVTISIQVSRIFTSLPASSSAGGKMHVAASPRQLLDGDSGEHYPTSRREQDG